MAIGLAEQTTCRRIARRIPDHRLAKFLGQTSHWMASSGGQQRSGSGLSSHALSLEIFPIVENSLNKS